MKNNKLIEMDKNFIHLQNSFPHFATIDSTNSYLLQNSFEHGKIIMADYQTKGRGRKQRKWETPSQQSLLFSILLKDNLDKLSHFIYTYISAVSIAEGLANYSSELYPALKWPNDVLINHKKVCGILIETKTRSNKLSKVVIGIGLNVNQKSEFFENDQLQFGTSLKIATGKPHNRMTLFKNILESIDKNYDLSLKNGEDIILDKWRNYCPHLGHEITINTNKGLKTGIFRNITRQGAMLLTINDEIEKFYAGEVSFDKRSI
ncbi:MAG: biotin--[acetyl-CoA-carboxylase] ligase [Candidatus Marinimicrobia bacterium]|nr:biotin--[acetyl-CoA-carboxylase] ligase [Candidatus Neomarinimicrobiota bacterium]